MSDRASVIMFKSLQTVSLTWTLVFGLKKILDLALLTSCPELVQYVSRTLFRVPALCESALIRTSESSANNNCEIEGAFLQTLTPSRPPISCSCASKLVSPSEHKKIDMETNHWYASVLYKQFKTPFHNGIWNRRLVSVGD